MNIKKDKALFISLITIILFTAFFLIILFFYNDTFLLEPSLKSFSREYYDWYMISYKIEGYMIEISYIVKMLFGLILPLEFLYIVFDEKYKKFINKKNLILTIIIGTSINLLIKFLIIHNAQHYRLFMDLIPNQISALVLLNLVLNVNKRINN